MLKCHNIRENKRPSYILSNFNKRESVEVCMHKDTYGEAVTITD